LTTELQQNRYDQLLRRVGGIIGPSSKVSEVLSELFPMFDVENMPAELLILAATRTAHGGGTFSGNATMAAIFQISNPVGSNHIVTVTRVIHSSTATTTHRWGRSPAIFEGSPIGAREFTDTRNPVANQPVAEIRAEARVALASDANQARVLASTPLVLENANDVVVLSPGFGWEIGEGTFNTTAFLSIYWRERVAEASELSL